VQQKSSVIRKAKKVDCVTKILAKKLTSLLAHPDIRNHLLTEINQSSKRENILFLDEFLTSTVNISGLPDQVRSKANKALKKVKVVKKLFSKTIFKQILVSPEIDLYFPVPNHRNEWSGNDELLIGIGSLDENVKEIKAFSVKTGRIRLLDTLAPPREPVLMLSPCEHQSHDPEILQISDIPPVEPAPQKSPNSYITVNYLKILNDYEPWHKGDPEIYVHFFQTDLKGNVSYNRRFNFPGVNREDVWYLIPNALGWNLCIHYTEEKNGPITYFLVYEEDVNYSVTIYVSIGLITFPITIHDGDDFVGRFDVNRNYVGFCPYSSIYNCLRCYTRTEFGTAYRSEAMIRVTRIH